MASVMDTRHEEASVLLRGVENMLRKLARFLVGRISLDRLQEILRYVFIEEIENKLRKENPTKNIRLTQLALLSGLDTRTLTKIRNSDEYRKPLYQEKNFLKEFIPGASILDDWGNNPFYLDENTGEPKDLPVSGKGASFESLFNDSIKSRGVTYKSLLNRLIQSGSVSHDLTTDHVRLEKRSYLPSASKDKLGAIEIGFSALGNMIDTVTKNICSLETGEERIYQRGAWTYRLSMAHRSDLRKELSGLLERTDLKAREIIERYEISSSGSNQITAGVSMFYFEESTSK